MEPRAFFPIYVYGRKCEVPEGLTIQKAMEFSGYQFIRSCGCRGGICGACLTEYRVPGSYRLHVVLACQTLAEPGMQITQSPFFPMNRRPYRVEALENRPGVLGEHYPEIYRCLHCNTCSRVCPMEIEVMEYVAAAMRGDIPAVATLSFQCVVCGACASKCPAEISQPGVALLARRLYGRVFLPLPKRLYQRIAEIELGRYEEVLQRLTCLPREAMMDLYVRREQEPQDNLGWVPRDRGFPELALSDEERSFP